jgi:uncharacterized protein (TIGR00255 family)
MIYSMTAFGRAQMKSDLGVAVWEIRSINHRYLEINTRLPEILREMEQYVREIIRQRFQRGKIECTLHFHPGSQFGSLIAINRHLLDQLITVANDVANYLPEKLVHVNLVDLLAWKGVIEENFDIGAIREGLLNLFKEAADDLKAWRQREGAMLVQGIEERLEKIISEIEKVKQYLPDILRKQRNKVLLHLEEARVNLEPQRLEQEMVYYAQKIDVSEEIERAVSHVAEAKRTLIKGKSVGRHLDFIMQELNREANTLASKSVDTQVTHAAIEMKVLTEQIREQVQNIE